ncbi:hypothetical protein VSU16_14865 (plasmid) [Cetobacterium somerae]|uniref:hypothetical protein n=1 Tax=Cetobacterium somerae TaxID=188913 RepID=UPI002E7B678F|nr:hypothetical protein [Cetobacterium somerae]WVJ03009.1 hypothetical protein VSU16_14865 [Cetobacterium somerae]
MIKLITNDKHTNRIVINPNDSLDFISSFENKINNILQENNEATLKKIKITLGSSKETSIQNTKDYPGVEGNAYILKKALASGDNGYFSGSKDRKVYSVFKDNQKIDMKYFDNHIKIRFRCRTAVERETLRSFLTLALTFETKSLNCISADLDYISDLESIQNEMFVIDLFIHARTCIKWAYEHTSKPLDTALFIGNNDVVGIIKNDDFENSLF